MRRGFPILILLLLASAALGVWAWSFGARKIEAPATNSQSSETAANAPASQPASLRVMTANIRLSDMNDGINAWPNRREFLVKTLLKYGPDVIGCQEVGPAQGDYLIKELGKWYGYYPRAGVGKITGTPGEGGGRLLQVVNQSFASLDTQFYRLDRFDIIDGEAGLVLPNDLQRDPTENTFFSLAVLKPKAGGNTLIVVDTHLRHQDAFAVKCAVTLRAKIAAMLKKYPGSGVVLMGDMNHDRRSKIYAAIVGAAGADDGLGVLRDSFDYAQRRPNESWGNWHAFTGIARAVDPTDLIFSKGFSAHDTQIIRDKSPERRYPSDHFFVMTELTAK